METYKMRDDYEFNERPYEFMRAYQYILRGMSKPISCTVVGTLLEKERILGTAKNRCYASLKDFYAYSRSDNPSADQILWSTVPMWSTNNADFLESEIYSRKSALLAPAYLHLR